MRQPVGFAHTHFWPKLPPVPLCGRGAWLGPSLVAGPGCALGPKHPSEPTFIPWRFPPTCPRCAARARNARICGPRGVPFLHIGFCRGASGRAPSRHRPDPLPLGRLGRAQPQCYARHLLRYDAGRPVVGSASPPPVPACCGRVLRAACWQPNVPPPTVAGGQALRWRPLGWPITRLAAWRVCARPAPQAPAP
jgi:hypothetical protein